MASDGGLTEAQKSICLRCIESNKRVWPRRLIESDSDEQEQSASIQVYSGEFDVFTKHENLKKASLFYQYFANCKFIVYIFWT